MKQLIDMQLDRLSAAEQRVLEAASIVGAEFSTNLVAAALELPAEQVDDTCDALARRALFLRAEPDGRYGVTHALIQEVCVERSSPSAAPALAPPPSPRRLERDPRAGETSHLLAKHFDAADDPARAGPRLPSGGPPGGSALRNLRRPWRSALVRVDLLPRLPAGRERDLLELRILETMCRQVSSNSFSAAFAGARAARDLRARRSRSLASPRRRRGLVRGDHATCATTT